MRGRKEEEREGRDQMRGRKKEEREGRDKMRGRKGGREGGGEDEGGWVKGIMREDVQQKT